jgi:hypothetical protein
MKREQGRSSDWLRRPYGRVFNNLGLPDTAEGRLEIAGITGAKLIEAAARAGGLVATFDSKSQFYAHHNTTVSEKHPGLGERDLVAEIVAAATPRGMLYVPYVAADCDLRAAREHPEWRPVSKDGTPLADNKGHKCLCLGSPYGQYIADYLRELAANYDIGGIFVDGTGIQNAPNYCYCDWCCAAFRQAHGSEPPRDPAEDKERWVQWMVCRAAIRRRFLAQFRDAVHAVKPGLPLLFGMTSLYRIGGWELEGGTEFDPQDLVWHEPAWLWASASIQYLRAAGGGIPVEFYTPTLQYSPLYPIAMPRQELRSRAMTAIANGGLIDFTLHGNHDDIRTINTELAGRAAWVEPAVDVRHCGIVFSERSMNLCDSSWYSEPSHFTTYGTLRAILEEKIPESYVCDGQLARNDLDGYAVLVLPNIQSLPTGASAHLRAFVSAGGGLVALAETSLYDGLGRARPDFELADLFGVHYRGQLADVTELPPVAGDIREGTSYPNRQPLKFIKLGEHPLYAGDPVIRAARSVYAVPEYRRGMPPDYDFVYPEAVLKVEAEHGVCVAAWEATQEPGQIWPVVTTRTYGKGRVVYIAANLGFQYCSHHTWPHVRRLLTNAIRYAAGDRLPPCAAQGPLQVQMTVFRQPELNRTVVHLLNDPAPHGYPPFTKQEWDRHFTNFSRYKEDVVPVFDLPVRLRGRFKRVYTVPGGELPVTVDGDYTVVRVPRLDTHLMVVGET